MTAELASTIAIAIGAVVILKFVITFVNGIFARLFRGGKDLKRKYGSWGKIT